MLFASFLLGLLIITTPIMLIFDGPIVHGIVAATAAVSIAVIAWRIRPGEAEFLSQVGGPVVAVAVVPALWFVAQVLPLHAVGLAHPIWESARTALGRPLAGSISIDPGATLICLAQYISTVAIALVAAAVATDRQRAEWILFALVPTTTVIALIGLAASLGGLIPLNGIDSGLALQTTTNCAALGIVLAAAAALHVLERARAYKGDTERPAVLLWRAFLVCLAAAAICFLAIVVGATGQTYFAFACGIATLAIAILIRHFFFGPWGFLAIVSTVAVVAIAAVAFQPAAMTVGLTLAFASDASPPLITLTQRILMETGWTGTGAGTFASIVHIYRDISELTARSVAPTAAAAIAIETGLPFLIGSLVAAAALVVVLLRGALRRGRDSVYSSAGAACVVTLTLLAFGNAAVFATPILIIVAAMVGIAVAQSRSRTGR
jgi:hypothetical protein